MRIRRTSRLKTRLLTGVFLLVGGTSLSISLLVSQRYGMSLQQELTAQSSGIAQAIALDAAEKILINDLVALQKTLDQHKKSHPSIAYIFVLQDKEILAHTFADGVPEGLIEVNPAPETGPATRRIVSTEGDRYVDFSWPVFGGNAGVVRLGISETVYREPLLKLWMEVGAVSGLILVVAVLLGLAFVNKITRPLFQLSAAAKKIENGEEGVRVPVHGEDEIRALARAFNLMAAHVEGHTRKLEKQAAELERSSNQTRVFCDVIQRVGSVTELEEVGKFLIRRLHAMVNARIMALLVFNRRRDAVFSLTADGCTRITDPALVTSFAQFVEGVKEARRHQEPVLSPHLLPDGFADSKRHSVVAFEYEGRNEGGLLLGCPESCSCEEKDLRMIFLVLSQASGVIRRAVTHEEEIGELRRRLDVSVEFEGMIGRDPAMQSVFHLVQDVAPTDAAVLIQGESGTGKELVARAVHSLSHRKNGPFVVINCSAYPGSLIESELFGHEKGAFTGATRRKTGRFEQAHKGTVFLDEIGEVPSSAQVKLLRVLQTQKFERVGGEETVSVDVRVVAATNKDILEEVKNGTFREDLYYRLTVVPILLPPLRERRNDIPFLARHFLESFSREQQKEVREFSPSAMKRLLEFHWPGNVRELENAVERATVLAKGKSIEVSDLPSYIGESATPDKPPEGTMSEHERTVLVETLSGCGWNKVRAARVLGISRSTLYQKIRKYGIEEPAATP